MNEIKFRGMDKETKKWVYGYFFKIWDETYILWGTTNGTPNMIEVIPETVGQFTNKLDKNGKEIYGSIWIDGKLNKGGDILQGIHGKYPITWDNDNAAFEARIIGFASTKAINWKDYEVIGTVFENGDLIK